jgi:hypothetical protein
VVDFARHVGHYSVACSNRWRAIAKAIGVNAERMKTGISSDMAIRLGRFFGTSAQVLDEFTGVAPDEKSL